MNTKLLVNGKLVKGKGEEQNVLNPATGKEEMVESDPLNRVDRYAE